MEENVFQMLDIIVYVRLDTNYNDTMVNIG